MRTTLPGKPASAAPMDATAIIIAFNEAMHIERCIARIRDHVRRVVIVDSFSTDGTQDLARAMGAEVIEHAFVNHAAQFNWGMEAADVTTGWILRLDADEYIDERGLTALRQTLDNADAGLGAIAMRRGVIFLGRRILHGGIGNVFLTRVWRTGAAKIEARWMDEQVLVHRGETVRLVDGAIIDENLNSIGWWTAKHNSYTTRQMIQSVLARHDRAEHIDLSKLNPSVRRKRVLREHFYARVPLFARAIAYFIYRYIFAGGFRDGRQGFLFHFLQGLWNFFLVDVKMFEARQVIADGGMAAFEEWVERVYGVALSAGAPAGGRVFGSALNG